MSQWHRNNPELYEQDYEPWDAIEAEADRIRKEGSTSPKSTERGMRRKGPRTRSARDASPKGPESPPS